MAGHIWRDGPLVGWQWTAPARPGMQYEGYAFTKWGARRAVRQALRHHQRTNQAETVQYKGCP